MVGRPLSRFGWGVLAATAIMGGGGIGVAGVVHAAPDWGPNSDGWTVEIVNNTSHELVFAQWERFYDGSLEAKCTDGGDGVVGCSATPRTVRQVQQVMFYDRQA